MWGQKMSIPNSIQSGPEVSEVLAINVKTWLSSTATDLPEDTPRNRTRTRRASLCQPFPSPTAITEEHEEDPLEMHFKNQGSRTLGHSGTRTPGTNGNLFDGYKARKDGSRSSQGAFLRSSLVTDIKNALLGLLSYFLIVQMLVCPRKTSGMFPLMKTSMAYLAACPVPMTSKRLELK
jgi:hypothetical protein